LPYYGLAGPGVPSDVGGGLAFASPTVTYDAVPLGEVAVHRDDPVHATDGSIGRVQGLVIDPRTQHVTHVLLQEGHLWGRKEVAIPIKAVTEVSDEGIKLSLAKHEVQDLPPVDIHHPGSARLAPARRRATLLPRRRPHRGLLSRRPPAPLAARLHCVDRLVLEDWPGLPDYTRDRRADRT
jgi:sporulation protein YlmC with PRC-barrel domain